MRVVIAMKSNKKRSLFEEIKQGILEIKAYKGGKRTLCTHEVIKKPLPDAVSNMSGRL